MNRNSQFLSSRSLLAKHPIFGLRAPLGADYQAEPDDILDTKLALADLGYYRTVDGSEPGAWVDGSLFDGIRRFQKDNGLKVDGFMRPGGETERMMRSALERDAPGNDNTKPSNDNCHTAALPGFGIFFRGSGRGGVCPPPRGPERNEGDCDHLLEKDEEICGRLKTPRGRAICWETAYQRHSACIAGRPMPPLLTGDWPGD